MNFKLNSYLFQIKFLHSLYMKEYLSTLKVYSKSSNDITNKVKTFKLLNINSLIMTIFYAKNYVRNKIFIYETLQSRYF